jgi:hypothetical protein
MHKQATIHIAIHKYLHTLNSRHDCYTENTIPYYQSYNDHQGTATARNRKHT